MAKKTRTDAAKVTRLYWFDSDTHLLMRTTYQDGPTRVETRFVSWGTAEGSKYPTRIERYEGGNLVFAFDSHGVTAGPKLDITAFRQ